MMTMATVAQMRSTRLSRYRPPWSQCGESTRCHCGTKRRHSCDCPSYVQLLHYYLYVRSPSRKVQAPQTRNVELHLIVTLSLTRLSSASVSYYPRERCRPLLSEALRHMTSEPCDPRQLNRGLDRGRIRSKLSDNDRRRRSPALAVERLHLRPAVP